MIIDEIFYIVLGGEAFDPLPLVRALEGEPSLTLEYHQCGGPHPRIPGGVCEGYLSIAPHEECGADLEAFLRTLLSFRNLILDEAAVWRVISIAICFQGQHNWELGSGQVRILADLNLTLAVSWYEDKAELS